MMTVFITEEYLIDGQELLKYHSFQHNLTHKDVESDCDLGSRSTEHNDARHLQFGRQYYGSS